MKIAVTGAAGFIGFNLTRKLIESQHQVIGLDNLTPSYSKVVAEKRNEALNKYGFAIKMVDLTDIPLSVLIEMFLDVDAVIHLAAWPGVRVSKLHPYSYSLNNINAFNKVIEAVYVAKVSKFIYASSSSVYGNLGIDGPVHESQADGNSLLSYYAATKWINETVARQYKTNFGLNSTALRFFTVYGPFGRPDMAYWDFTKKLLANEVISLHGENGGTRCFTYIDDAIEIILRLIKPECNLENVPALNVSNGQPRTAYELMQKLSQQLEIKNPKYIEIIRPSDDAIKTWANTDLLQALVGNVSSTDLTLGTSRFINWFLDSQR